MKKETIKYLKIFKGKTGIKPKSGRLGVGSMKKYIQISINFNVRFWNFMDWESYYKNENKTFMGVEIKYLDNIFGKEFHENNGILFWIEKKELNKIYERN